MDESWTFFELRYFVKRGPSVGLWYITLWQALNCNIFNTSTSSDFWTVLFRAPPPLIPYSVTRLFHWFTALLPDRYETVPPQVSPENNQANVTWSFPVPPSHFWHKLSRVDTCTTCSQAGTRFQPDVRECPPSSLRLPWPKASELICFRD